MKQRRREPLKFLDFLASILHGLGIFFVGLVVFIVLSTLVYGVFEEEHNNLLESRATVAKLLISYGKDANDTSESTRAKREKVASQLLSTELLLKNAGVESAYDFTEYQWNRIDMAAQNGEPIAQDFHQWQWGDYLRFLYLMPGGLILWFILSALVAYSYQDEEYGFYPADLPWRKVWPVGMTFLCGPVFWLMILYSAFGLRKVPRIKEKVIRGIDPDLQLATDTALAATQARLARQEQTDEEALAADVSTEWDTWVAPVTKSYLSAPRAARAAYMELRVQKSQQSRKGRLKELRNTSARSREEGQDLSRQLQAVQTARNEADAAIRTIEEAMAEEDSVTVPAVIGEEFDRMLQLPGVLAVQVVNETIKLIVRATTQYDGELYDLGDWQLTFGPDTLHIQGRELRKGVRADWKGNYPVYRLRGGSFCFGTRETLINEHLVKGQYLEAMALAVECLNSVNEEDQPNIPNAFNQIKEVAHV